MSCGALHRAMAHAHRQDQGREKPIYPNTESLTQEREGEGHHTGKSSALPAAGLRPGITCPAEKLSQFCHVRDSPGFCFLGWFYADPRGRYCCNKAVLTCGANLAPRAQAMQPAHCRKADRTDGRCLASSCNAEERPPPVPALQLCSSFLWSSSLCISLSTICSQEALPLPWSKKRYCSPYPARCSNSKSLSWFTAKACSLRGFSTDQHVPGGRLKDKL